MSITENKERIGAFTSSELHVLCQPKEDSAKAKTYIKEKQIEKRMGSCLDGGAHTQTLAWGNFMEMMVYSVLGVQYQIASKETNLHPLYGAFWSGSKDLFTVDKDGVMESIAEIKCYQKKNFALYTDCILKKDTELMKIKFPKEYWQIVSNAIINEVEIGEAITYMPYVSEAEAIKEMAEDYDGADQWKYKFIRDQDVKDLPFIADGGYYKNINKFAFIIPEEDKELLTSRILQANELLNQ